MSRALDIMTESPETVPITATVGDAIRVLQGLDVRHVPVVNQRREVVGMLSDRDLRAVAVPRTIDQQWLGDFRVALEMPVSHIMSSDPITVEEEAEASEIIELMLEHKIGAVPVLDADGALVGIVSYMDLLRTLYELETAQG